MSVSTLVPLMEFWPPRGAVCQLDDTHGASSLKWEDNVVRPAAPYQLYLSIVRIIHDFIFVFVFALILILIIALTILVNSGRVYTLSTSSEMSCRGTWPVVYFTLPFDGQDTIKRHRKFLRW